MPRRKDGEETKNRILVAAAEMFAKNGFLKTTNADIAAACGGINAALISYYFTDKATLYKEAWMYSYQTAIAKYPMKSAYDKTLSPELRLCAVIEAKLNRNATGNSVVNSIIHHEISSFTGILTEFYMQVFFDVQNILREIVYEFLGEKVPDYEKEYSVFSILAMILIPIRKIQSMNHDAKSGLQKTDLKQRILHVQEFALGGLIQLKSKYESE